MRRHSGCLLELLDEIAGVVETYFQCTNEEIYNALLIYTKNQLFEKGYQNGKKKIY